jgi:zinc-ribbon domain
MAYCPNCGTEIAEAARFCSNCGRWLGGDAPSSPAQTDAAPRPPPATSSPIPPSPDRPSSGPLSPPPPAATPSPSIPPAARGLDDVPWWLGWLGLVLAPTGIGFPIYCWWAYRRGRRDGVVWRESNEEPYRSMGWKTVGWVVFLIVPIVGFYTYVHLPTLWYKHGLRVGARAPSAASGFTSLPSLAVAVGVPVATIFIVAFSIGLAGGIGGGSGSRPTPIPVEQITTAPAPPTAVANFTESDVVRLTQTQVSKLPFPQGANWLNCTTATYHAGNHIWTVTCSFYASTPATQPIAGETFTYTFDDVSGKVTQ